MKVRLGFISNSSTCNFVIFTKVVLSKSELMKRLREYFRKSSMALGFSKIKGLAERFFEEAYQYKSLDEAKNDIYSFFHDKIDERAKKGFKFFYNGNIVTEFFCEDLKIPNSYYGISINIDEEDFYLFIEGI